VSIQVPILTVTTNEDEHLKKWLKCVESLGTDTVKPLPCVADNASSDGTVGVIWEAIRSRRLSPENVLWLHSNHGFPAAQNQLIRQLGTHGQYRWFATLNIDASAKPDWLSRLVEFADKTTDKVGMWGGPIYVPESDRISSAGHAFKGNGKVYDIDRNATDHLLSTGAGFEPFCPCFAASLWSFEMVKEVGLPDSGQFLYYDDVELGFKARILGWRAGFVKDAIAYHRLPNEKKTVDRQRQLQLQLRGRLLMILRYLPDAEVRALLLSLDDEERAILDTIDSRDRIPFQTNVARANVYSDWVDKLTPRIK